MLVDGAVFTGVGRRTAAAANETGAGALPRNEHLWERRFMRKEGRHDKKVRIGLSGWTYAPWRGHFYPKGLVQKRELSYAADQFPALEVNGTFYGLQKPEVFGRWEESVPNDFVFAIKGSRYITHVLRLRDVETPLSNFLASGLLRLGSKLGPLLWQLPSSFRFDAALMEKFLKLLPKDTQEAAELAKRHDEHLDGRAWVETDKKRPHRLGDIGMNGRACGEQLRRYADQLGFRRFGVGDEAACQDGGRSNRSRQAMREHPGCAGFGCDQAKSTVCRQPDEPIG